MNTDQCSLLSRLLNRSVGCLLFVLLLVARAQAAQVVYVANSPEASPTREQIETAARFYGLTVVSEVLRAPQDAAAALRAVASLSTVAVVLDADAMSFVPRQSLLSAMQRGKQFVPLMIAGVNASTSVAQLDQWSSGAVEASRRAEMGGLVSEQIGSLNKVSRQLQGSKLPLKLTLLDYLVLSPSRPSDVLAGVQSERNALPIFVRVPSNGPELFFAAEIRPTPVEVSPDPYRQQAVFATIAAPMMFLQYAAADRAWHSPGDYANFTIDDLWLREPYGHLNFAELLAHSQQHDFHTTIAFIPWNYDRSQPAVASLFRAHPDRFSVCVHGNDHIHQEFGPVVNHPLSEQVKNIDQSLARMRKFTELTGIPFDPVMVFPHSVSPERTFAELKRANYVATANSLNVPSDAAAPPDAEFALRTATLNFANFPSLRRYSAETEIPHAQLAIDAFLGNPMLFYAHESYFASGIGAFDSLADSVNRLQPGLQWESLGTLVQHLYLEKLEDDGSIAVRAYSPSLRIRNDESHEALFRVEKQEDFHLPVRVFVDGQDVPFSKNASGLSLQLPMKPGSTRLVEVRYGSPEPPATVDLRSHSAAVAPIRLLSDFRDNVVSRSVAGRWFIRSYVAFGTRWELAFLGLASVFLGLLAYLGNRRRTGVRSTGMTRTYLRLKNFGN